MAKNRNWPTKHCWHDSQCGIHTPWQDIYRPCWRLCYCTRLSEGWLVLHIIFYSRFFNKHSNWDSIKIETDQSHVVAAGNQWSQ